MKFLVFLARLIEPFEILWFGGSHYAGLIHQAEERHKWAHIVGRIQRLEVR